MGGLFGVISKNDCVNDLFFGTDYHSHLGTKRGGLAVKNDDGFIRFIHNIENAQFRSKFETDLDNLYGNMGIGVISDYDDQPLLIRSHLGNYAIVTVGLIQNADELVKNAFKQKKIHFSEMGGGAVNPTELVSTLINQESTFSDGIQNAQNAIQGSCSLLILTENGVYASRDKLGRTPVVIGEKEGSFAATLETCAFPNLEYKISKYLGPGEIVFLTNEGIEQIKLPEEKLQICGFLWVYYGYPASNYEGINVESVRNRCGAKLAQRDTIKVDFVAGIPDSGIGHGLGYASESDIPFKRPFVKYTPTWPRSFMPQDQSVQDSIVRGTQLKDTIQRLYEAGATEVHMRPACPPLVYACKFLNFSRSKSELDLAARKAISELEGDHIKDLSEYAREDTEKYQAMVERIRLRLNLTTLNYQRLDDLVEAIGLPKERLCTYCWDGAEI